MRIDYAGNVGIGGSPSKKLHVYNTASADVALLESTQVFSTLAFKSSTNASTVTIGIDGAGNASFENKLSSGNMTFVTNGSERMRVSSSGHIFVGSSSYTGNTTGSGSGFYNAGDGMICFASGQSTPAIFNRTSADGKVIEIRRDGTTVGSIDAYSSAIQVGQGNVYLKFTNATDTITPANGNGTNNDNAIDLGSSSARFDDIYATNGTIQTSDRNEKQDIEELTDAETRVAVAAKGLLRKFKWKSAVAEKGDDARIHFGIIAQDLQDAFTAEGLDASDYAMFCSNTWTDEETGEEKTRLGVRYSELLAFIIAAI
jgi:hypothetical protein